MQRSFHISQNKLRAQEPDPSCPKQKEQVALGHAGTRCSVPSSGWPWVPWGTWHCSGSGRTGTQCLGGVDLGSAGRSSEPGAGRDPWGATSRPGPARSPFCRAQSRQRASAAGLGLWEQGGGPVTGPGHLSLPLAAHNTLTHGPGPSAWPGHLGPPGPGSATVAVQSAARNKSCSPSHPSTAWCSRAPACRLPGVIDWLPHFLLIKDNPEPSGVQCGNSLSSRWALLPYCLEEPGPEDVSLGLQPSGPERDRATQAQLPPAPHSQLPMWQLPPQVGGPQHLAFLPGHIWGRGGTPGAST